MTDFQQRQKAKKILYSKGTFVVLGVLICIGAVKTLDVYHKMRIAETKLGETKLQYDDLKQREIFLNDELDRLSTEEGKEAIIRTKLGLAKEGEHIIVLVGSSTANATTTKKTLWQNIKSIFTRE